MALMGVVTLVQELLRLPMEGYNAPSEGLLSLKISTCKTLVTKNALDNFRLPPEGGDTGADYHPVEIVTAPICTYLDLSCKNIELVALKFLITTGCQVINDCDSSGGSKGMMHNTQLLQTIQVAYHVYLQTRSGPNCTTALAALQQLASGVFFFAWSSKL